jgi:hypothetical protein
MNFKTIAVVFLTSVGVASVYKLCKDVKSNKLAAKRVQSYRLNQHQRGKFTEIVVPKRFPVSGHTHGESAALRSAASSAAAAYAYSIGKTPFYLSMSASDQRAGREGERTMHWSKDFNAEARVDAPDSGSALVMIDVDEHIADLPSLLHEHFLPAILYTFQPSAASGICQDYRFTFDSDNNVVYDVAGGGQYKHKIWNYAPDCVTMRKTFMGLTYAKSFFTIEKRMVDMHHQMILLTPLAKFGLLGSILSYNVKGEDLKRLEPVQGDFARLAVAKSLVQDGDYEHLMSTSRLGRYNCATVSLAQDDALALAARNSDSKLSPFQVKSMIPGIENEAAVALVDYHRQKVDKPAPRAVIPSDAVNSYTYEPVFTLEEKPSVAPFMNPILPDAYAPTLSIQNDEAMVKGRISGLAKEPDPLEEKEFKYAREFAELLRDEIGVLEPVGHEEIVEKLHRPEQRRITEEASFAARVDKTVKSFMKKEAYQKPTDPRPIATINGKHKYEYSAYTYAVSEALKKTSWYAFGRKPVGISQRVMEVCMNAVHVILTDLSRFDGRVNLSLRQLEEIVMQALFKPEHHEAMLRLMRTQHGGKGITKLGVKYKNKYNRLSGSPETAIFNTICNAFMAYVAFREAGCDPVEAYKKLGVYGGDDGITPDVDAALYIKTAAKFGHVLEAEKINKGDKGVNFLARIYSSDVWNGDTSSCADIARALSKFHLCVAHDVATKTDKLFEKSYALYLTDAETPIIGDFVCRVVELSNGRVYKNLLKIWNSDLPEEEHYPNVNHDYWMEEILVDQKLDGFKIQEFREWLAECKTLEDLLQCPSFIEKPDLKRAKVDIKINDDLLTSEQEFELAIQAYLEKKRKSGDAPTINLSQAKEPAKSDELPVQPPIMRAPQLYSLAGGRIDTQPPSAPKSKRVFKRSANRNARRHAVSGVRTNSSRAHEDIHAVGDLSGATGSGNATGRCNPVRPAPKKDLSRYGIEPNPGPSGTKIHSGARRGAHKNKGTKKTQILKVSAAMPQRVSGRGGYIKDLAGQGANWVGDKVGGWLEKLFGLGTYSVKKNSLVKQGVGTAPNDPPTMSNSNRGTVIRHREFVQDIVSAEAFTIQTFPINPGLPLTCPWASTVSPSFTQWIPDGMIWEYKSTATTSLTTATNQAAGVVIMATNYNVQEPTFPDKRTMENYTYVTSCSPYENAIHPVECAPDTMPVHELYVRSTGITSSDLRFNDLGNFQVAVTGCPANGGKIGELWLSYEIELLKPRLPTTAAAGAPVHYSYNSTIYPSLTAPTAANLFGTVGVAGSKVIARGVGANTIIFNAAQPTQILFTQSGRYVVVLTAIGTSATIDVDPPLMNQGVTGAEIFSVGTSYSAHFSNDGFASGALIVMDAVDVDLSIGSGPQGFLYNTSIIPAAVTNLDLFVFAVPAGFTVPNPHATLSLDQQVLELQNTLKRLIRDHDREYFGDDYKSIAPPAA